MVFAMIAPISVAGQILDAPNPGSVEKQSADEIPIPLEQSQTLADVAAMIQNREYARAEKSLHDALLLHPDAAEAHFLLGYTLYREDKADASLAEYTAGARLQRPGANDLAVVAMDYFILHDYADADKWLTQAVAWVSDSYLYRYYLARTKYAENRFHEAIDNFDQCLKIRPRDVKTEYNLGLAYAGMDRNADAAVAYQTAIAWQQSAEHPDPQPWLDLGILQLSEGHAADAAASLTRAVALDDHNPRIHEELGEALQQVNDLPHAQAELEKAASLAPNVSSLHFELGRIYQKEGMRAQAQEQFARCAALNATHSTDSAERQTRTSRTDRQCAADAISTLQSMDFNVASCSKSRWKKRLPTAQICSSSLA